MPSTGVGADAGKLNTDFACEVNNSPNKDSYLVSDQRIGSKNENTTEQQNHLPDSMILTDSTYCTVVVLYVSYTQQ